MAGTQIRPYKENVGMASRRSVTHHDAVAYRSSLLISEMKKTFPPFLSLSHSRYSHNLFSHKNASPFRSNVCAL